MRKIETKKNEWCFVLSSKYYSLKNESGLLFTGWTLRTVS